MRDLYDTDKPSAKEVPPQTHVQRLDVLSPLSAIWIASRSHKFWKLRSQVSGARLALILRFLSVWLSELTISDAGLLIVLRWTKRSEDAEAMRPRGPPPVAVYVQDDAALVNEY